MVMMMMLVMVMVMVITKIMKMLVNSPEWGCIMTYRECGLGYEDDVGISGQYQHWPPFGGTVSSFSKWPQNGQTGQLKSVR